MVDIYNTPSMEAPQGQTSNLVNPVSLKDSRIGLSSAALGVALIFVGIRVYVRHAIKRFNSEDWVFIFAMLAFIGLESMLIVVSLYGDGKHLSKLSMILQTGNVWGCSGGQFFAQDANAKVHLQWDVSLAELYSTLYYENIAEIMYCMTMFPLKYVLLHQIKSIFFAHDKKSPFHLVIWILIVANFLLYVALGLAFVFACSPREKIYHPAIDGRCISATICMTAAAALNIASDISILIIPLFGIAKLQMPLKKKLITSSVFGIGVFAIAASCVRMYYGIELFSNEDSTWVFMGVGNWTTIEFTMGFVIAGSPYVPRFLELISGGKKQSAPVYPSYQVSNYAPQKLHSMDQPPSTSWIALRDQDGVSQVGLANSQYMPR